jgi:hypothetical protein
MRDALMNGTVELPFPWWLSIFAAIWLCIAGCTIVAVFQFANFCRKCFVEWIGKPHWEDNRDLAFWVYIAAAVASLLAIGVIVRSYMTLETTLYPFLSR